MANETRDQQRIRLDLGREPAVKLFRNNVGSLKDESGRWVDFGVGGKGGSDLIGWRSTLITPAHVGMTLAVFSALEVKAVGGKHPLMEAQELFLAMVQRGGGISGVVRTTTDARALLGLSTKDLLE